MLIAALIAICTVDAYEKATISYTFQYQNISHTKVEEGRYSAYSRIANASGRVVHVLSENGGNDGCMESVNLPDEGIWIALIQRGECLFQTKIHNHAVQNDAVAVIVYNNKDEKDLVAIGITVGGVQWFTSCCSFLSLALSLWRNGKC